VLKGATHKVRWPRVAVIIVVWNGRDDTLECLDSLRADTYANKEIIIVDNGSTDDSVAAIRAAFPEVNILRTGRNLGFTGGNNVGIRSAQSKGADYVFLLNNDTTVEPAALSELVAAAEAEQRLGLLAPVIHYFDPPRAVWFAGSNIDLIRATAYHNSALAPERTSLPYETPWISGCAMLLRTALAIELKGFDDRYYLSWEDVDLSLRVSRAGRGVGVVPAARIYHKGGRSGDRLPGSRHYYAARNRLLLVREHARSQVIYWRAAFYTMFCAIRDACRLYRADRDELRSFLFNTFEGLRDHFLGRYGARSQ
jgi:GT2 family glycosyltransferase